MSDTTNSTTSGTGDSDLDVAVSAAMEATEMLEAQDGASTDTSERARFVPGYQTTDARILRSRLRVESDGTATVAFRGQLLGLDREHHGIGVDGTLARVRAERTDGYRISIYAEVALDADTLTEIKVAVVPTGKRVPLNVGGKPAKRLGSVEQGSGWVHVYLLNLNPAADRVAHDAAYEARRAAKRAARQAPVTLDDLTYGPSDPDWTPGDDVDLLGPPVGGARDA